ncbi:hypothetical protein ACVGVM_21285 [Pseudonocardia bannensis]|uniref:Uncharacterized protein n=1 Tax=Pseudonocardia bannensis TaxID=630973 RepID=A0A848DQZ0_9PSEU|nr:hypothetical protein [Pseudonocardia bannensis]NMH94933.1 hypothetical protein [Pseudonocardia bannensis]
MMMAVGDFTLSGAEARASSHAAKVKDLIVARNADVILGIGDSSTSTSTPSTRGSI